MLTANTNDSQRSVCYDSLRTRGKARSVNQRMVAATAVILAVMALVACDDGQTRITAPTTFPAGATSPTVGTSQTAVSEEGGLPGLRGGTQTVVDAAPATPPVTPDLTLPTPTPVTATGTGEATTSLDALASLKAQALNWQRDVRFALLANVRPGQEGKLLGVALGDPDVFEATPGGEGRNWTLVAVSPSRGAIAVSAEGAFVDLTSEGAVTGEMIGSFADPGLQALELETLDLNTLVDSDSIWAAAGPRVEADWASLALLTPAGLGLGLLERTEPRLLAYQLFSVRPETQIFAYFDALTGQLIVDGTPP